MIIHLPAILGFTRGTRVLTHGHIPGRRYRYPIPDQGRGEVCAALTRFASGAVEIEGRFLFETPDLDLDHLGWGYI